MNNLENLIARYCPDGVERMTLDQLVLMKAGVHIKASEIVELPDEAHPYPCYGGNGLRGYVGKYNQSENRLLIGRQGALCGNIKYAEDKFYATEHAVVCTPVSEFDDRWLYYMLVNMDLNQYKTKSAQPGLAVGNIQPLPLLVPPIEIQREVARLLDAYMRTHSELIEKLHDEISLHERELATFRESLLTFSERECRWATLGELGTFMRGSSFQKKHFVTEGTPCIHYGQVHTQFTLSTDHVVSHLDAGFAKKMKRAQPGDLIIATTSEDDQAVGKAIAWLGDEDVVISNDAYIYRHTLDPMFMAYIFATDIYQVPKLKGVTGTKVRRVHEKHLSKISVPVPSMEVQRATVETLNRHTDAHNKLINELQKELTLLDEQAIEFRNQLLTFPERAA